MERAGEPIPGSKYVRAFCRSCGEPMRVSAELFRLGTYEDCSDCWPRDLSGGTLSAIAEYETGIDGGESGSWHNVVRALEDAA